MDAVEEGLLKEIEEGILEVVPFYSDWLKEQGREEEAKFWSLVQSKGWIPNHCSYVHIDGPMSQSETGSLDWYRAGSLSGPNKNEQGAMIPVELFNRLVDRLHWCCEYPSRLDAYKDLYQAWRKENELH